MSYRDELADQILAVLAEHPGSKASEIADSLDVDRSLIHSVMYRELRARLRQDSAYRWYVKDGYQAGTPAGSDAERDDTAFGSRISRLAGYYLDVLSHDESYKASCFAQSRYKPEYAELPSFPPPADEEMQDAEHSELRAELTRLAHASGSRGARKAAVVGYPVYAQFLQNRAGTWSGFILKPLFLFEVDADDPASLRLVDPEFPQINRKALEVVLGVSRGALMEELLALSSQLGLADPETAVEPDELFLRLQAIRPEWEWKEDLAPADPRSAKPLSAVSESGIYNRCIFLMTERSPYTKGLEEELQGFRRMSDGQVRDTALGSFLSMSAGAETKNREIEAPLLEAIALNSEQRAAVQAAMTRPLTVITGPPGTGKSQVVTEIVVNAVWHGQRVLVASKNNKAVDVVGDRVNGLSKRPALFRLGSTDLAQDLADYLASILSGSVDDEDRRYAEKLRADYKRILAELRDLADSRREVIELRNRVDELSQDSEKAREALGDELFRRAAEPRADNLTESLERAVSSLERLVKTRQSPLTRLLWPLLSEKRRRAAQDAYDRSTAARHHLSTEVFPELVEEPNAQELGGRLRELLPRVEQFEVASAYHEALNELLTQPRLEELTARELTIQDRAHGVATRLWDAWLQLLPDRIDAEARKVLTRYAAVLRMLSGMSSNDPERNRTYAKFYELSQQASPHLSAWAVTSLSAKGRVPFEPAVFDVVVIDEASQCDIASALPLLFRAKRAVIIGDPNQLRHISAVTEKLDRQLLLKHELFDSPELAYSVNSLYDAAAGASGDDGVIALRDHHRSHPDVIQFSNRTFYGEKLRIATRYDTLRFAWEEPTVRWEHVRGKTVRPDEGGANNRTEAEQVVKELVSLFEDEQFDGTVGVVTPFRSQANLIRRLLEDGGVSGARQSAAQLIVDTVHRFQGDERDVMLFSPVVSDQATESALRFLELNKHLFNVAITRARAGLKVIGDFGLAQRLPEAHVLRRFAEYSEALDSEQAPPDEVDGEDAPDTTAYPPVNRPELVSDWERRFYTALREQGLRPIPQYAVEQYLLDFALFEGERKLAIEIDGEHYHRRWDGEPVIRDRLRTIRLTELGWDVVRFWVYEIRDAERHCVEKIRAWTSGGAQ